MDEFTTPVAEDQALVFDLDLKDEEVLNQVKESITASENFWNGKDFNYKSTVEENVSLYLPNHWKGTEVYDYDRDNLYQDPRIWVSVETVMGMVTARIPQPEVKPDEDSLISRKLALDVQEAIFAHSQKYQMDDLMGVAGRNMLVKRIGWLKLRFDQARGPHGEIVPEVVDPLDIIVDKDARGYEENPRLIAHRVRNKTGDELCSMLGEEAHQKIYKAWGVKRRNKAGDLVAYKSQLAKKKDIWEVWFTYYKDNEAKEGAAWVDVDFQNVFGAMRNPHFNYPEDNKNLKNITDIPPKPFVEFVYLSDGKTYIPPTSAVEQAAGLQKNLNKRGYQITRNADQAGSGIIFNTDMLKKEEAAKLIGSPDERLGVKGDVRQAYARVAPPLLPAYVQDDKLDARNEIDTIFGTHKPSRGDSSSTNRTLGQDMLQVQQDQTRQDEISKAMTRAATKYYRLLTQLMKVYYTEDHWYKITGPDGQFDFVMMKSDNIRDGIDISVAAGSMLPLDKMSLRASAMELATAGLIDPLSLYEAIGLPNPKQTLERTLKFKLDPLSFMNEAKDEEFEREAFMDIEVLNRGKMPDERKEVTPQHLDFHQRYMISGEFDALTDNIKALHLAHVREEADQANKLLQLAMTEAPTQEELDAQAAAEAGQAETGARMLPGEEAAPEEEEPATPGSDELPIA